MKQRVNGLQLIKKTEGHAHAPLANTPDSSPMPAKDMGSPTANYIRFQKRIPGDANNIVEKKHREGHSTHEAQLTDAHIDHVNILKIEARKLIEAQQKEEKPFVGKIMKAHEPDPRRQACAAKYGARDYLPEDQKRLPPMLYTFPGSGNTWCRLLIEYATSIYSGSAYDDAKLLEILPGEFTCNWRVSVVKVHPIYNNFSDLHFGHFVGAKGKCKGGDVHRFERAVLLFRDPFDSIWSEYQREVTQSHVQGINRSKFDSPRWEKIALHLSSKYHEMWSLHYDMIEKSYAAHDILFLKYEDLKNKSVRIATLANVASFLRLPTTPERLECAFYLADNGDAHRQVDALAMTKDVAYTRELACRMWNLFGAYASKHGYNIWGGYNCPDIPQIHNVNVGSQEQLNASQSAEKRTQNTVACAIAGEAGAGAGGGRTNKPIADFSVVEVASLVTRLTSTPKYEAAVRDNGLNGATLVRVASWEELRDDFGIAKSAQARLVFDVVQQAKGRC